VGHVNTQCGPTNNSTAPQFMDFVQNIYAYTGAGNPVFTTFSTSNVSLATWQGLGEDVTTTTSTIAGLGFTGQTNCQTVHSDNNYPENTNPQVDCDNYSFLNTTGPGHGFSGSVFTNTYGPTVRISLPLVPDTYPTATLQPNSF
jgi:hypothetical protein